MSATRFCLVMWMWALAAAGCVRPAGPLFAPVEPPIVFPPPPDLTRLAYVGRIRSDRDLNAAVSGWQALRGVLTGGDPPRELSAPAGLTVTDDDRLWVTDPPLRCVHVFDLARRAYRRLDTAGGVPFVSPADVAAADGRIFVTDAGRGTVDVFGEAGDFITTWSGLGLARPVGIAFAPWTQRLYVIDSAQHVCVGLSLDGQEVLRFGRRGDENGGLNHPTFLACDAELGLVISDSLNFRIQMFDMNGSPRGAFGKKGDAAGDFALPKGVAVDADRNVYVADAHFENIQIFNPHGRLLLAFGGEGHDPGRFWLPQKITFDAQNRLWVADSYNRRVQVFRRIPAAPHRQAEPRA